MRNSYAHVSFFVEVGFGHFNATNHFSNEIMELKWNLFTSLELRIISLFYLFGHLTCFIHYLINIFELLQIVTILLFQNGSSYKALFSVNVVFHLFILNFFFDKSCLFPYFISILLVEKEVFENLVEFV